MQIKPKVTKRIFNALHQMDAVLEGIDKQDLWNFTVNELLTDCFIAPPKVLGRQAYLNQQAEDEADLADTSGEGSKQIAVDISGDNWELLQKKAEDEARTPEAIVAELLANFVTRLEEEQESVENARRMQQNAERNDVAMPPNVLGRKAYLQNDERHHRNRQADKQD